MHFVVFFALFISFKSNFHVDVERMIVKTREMQRNICVDGLKMYRTIPLPQERVVICGLRSTKLTFVGYGQLNSTTGLDFCTRYV